MNVNVQYNVVRSNRKSISLQVDENCKITVKAPLYYSDEKIEEFLEQKREWLQKAVASQLRKMKNKRVYTDSDIELMRKKAKEVIPEKVKYYAEIMGVQPTCVKINSAQKRYGSCSGKNSLNFSLYLMDKEEEFINYVVIHELAHIKHHNHSKDFYKFIEKFMPEYKSVVNRNK